MQATFQNQQHKHIFATKIIKELEAEAQERIKGKKLTLIDETNEYVTQKIIEYERLGRWICDKDVMEKEKLLPILKRIKSEAVGEMVNRQVANEKQIRQLALTEDDILFEIEFKQLLADWVELESDESLIARQGLRDFADAGKRLDYGKLDSLKESLNVSIAHEKDLLDIHFNRLPEREKYDRHGNEIEYSPEEKRRQDISEELREVISNCVHIRKEINNEKWRISEEKSRVPNLCYYILYDISDYLAHNLISVHFDPCSMRVIGFEDSNRVNYRIQHLSTYYLKIMVGIICKINNEFYKEDIESNSRILKKMSRQSKKISITDKRALIQMGKAEGLTNEQISKQLGKGFGLRTVERYSK